MRSPPLQDAHDRGLNIMVFQAQSGAGDDTDGEDVHHLFNKKQIDASCARIVDCLQQFPMVDGFVLDGVAPPRTRMLLSSHQPTGARVLLLQHCRFAAALMFHGALCTLSLAFISAIGPEWGYEISEWQHNHRSGAAHTHSTPGQQED